MVQMKDGRIRFPVLLDIKKVPEMNRLEWKEGDALHIGAAVPLNEIVAFEAVTRNYNLLAQGCSIIGSIQLRNRATAGGNICNAAPSADSAPALICLGARAVIASPGNTRTVPVEQFFKGPGKTVLQDNELLVEIEIPFTPLSSGSYLRHIPRNEMDIAVAGVASFLVFDKSKTCMEARITLGAVAPTPLRAPQAEALLTGKIIDKNSIEKAAEAASNSASPISDVRSSADYRREIIKVLTRRTLKKALDSYSG
jgi:carbon-monoxide dehydrogenase medium subunit